MVNATESVIPRGEAQHFTSPVHPNDYDADNKY